MICITTISRRIKPSPFKSTCFIKWLSIIIAGNAVFDKNTSLNDFLYFFFKDDSPKDPSAKTDIGGEPFITFCQNVGDNNTTDRHASLVRILLGVARLLLLTTAVEVSSDPIRISTVT